MFYTKDIPATFEILGLRNGSDTHRSPEQHKVKAPQHIEKSWNIRAILSMSEKFKCSSDVLWMKYNCVVLFLR